MTIAVVFILGLVVGSFLNVVISRLPTDDGIVRGRSHCPYCKTKLAWYDLVPLMSFFVLGRQCRHCDKKISWQYPLVEILTAAGFALIFTFSTGTLLALWLSVLWALSVLIAVYDAQHQIIPDSFLAISLLWVLVGLIFFWRDTIEVQALAAIALFGFFLVLYLVSSGRWIGGGDVKLAFVLGFWLGWPAIIVTLFLAYVGGAIVVLPFLLLKKTDLSSRIPFGPFLVASSWAAFLWASPIVNWYLSLII